MNISLDLLKKQNAETSNALIQLYADSEDFQTLAKIEGDAILARDQEDADKLQAGIDFAKEKGVVDPNFVPEPYVEIDVLGKTPEEVCDIIIGYIKENENESVDSGSVIVLCGLSGTGKGTTVAKLSERLSEDQQVVCWSNGNIFRSVTLLAATWCEQQADLDGFNAEKALTPENLASFMSMLSFGKFNGKFDTKINGLGLDLLVSEIQNTELKQQKVSKNIPTVAEKTQGEVITFAADAIKTMSQNGISILLEGREQTVNYVCTPLRFTLILSDETLIGKRRAAQRLYGEALKSLEAGDSTCTTFMNPISYLRGVTTEKVKKVLDGELVKMLEEVGK